MAWCDFSQTRILPQPSCRTVFCSRLAELDAEQKRQPAEYGTEALATETAHALGEPRAIDRENLAHVDDARAREVCLALAKSDVAGHRRQAEVRRDRRHDRGADCAPVEAIV